METRSTAAAHEDKEYVTGSRIPVRDSSWNAGAKTLTDQRGIDDTMQRATTVYVPQKGAGTN